MINTTVIEEAMQHAEAAKKNTADLAERIVRAITASPEKAEDHIVKLRETLIDIYQNGRWDGMKDATNALLHGTPSEKIAAKQAATATAEVKKVDLVKDSGPKVDTTRIDPKQFADIPKYGLPCTVCGTYSEVGKSCNVCEVRKKRGMIPS